MPSITYTAKREIERTAFGVSGTDLSVNATDDSFNSTVTSLLGVANDDWIKVSGFANAANNGWFQASAASTSTKISQDTTAALVAESAGPLVQILGYERGYDQVYGLDFDLAAVAALGKAEKHRVITWGGRSESNLIRLEREWELRTLPIAKAALGQWREIFASLAAGESFTFDPYGTISSPSGEQFEAELLSVQHREARLGVSQYFTFDFRVRDRAVV